jgi:hypothetical protein
VLQLVVAGLYDENGVGHRLSELQDDNVLVLHLSRGEHCPRERMFHRELLRFHEWCSVAFTELVSILPNSRHDVSRLKLSTGAHWTFLSDEDLEVQQHFDNEVVTFGFFDGTLEPLERSQEDADFESRRTAIDPWVEVVIANGVYEIIETLVVDNPISA